MRPINKAISYITLGVTDLNKMQIFYSALGFIIHRESDNADHPYIMYKCGNVILALYPKNLLARQSGCRVGGNNQAVSISLNVEYKTDVDDILLMVKKKHATVTREAFQPEWGGYCGYFQDPETNLWEVVWNPEYSF